MDAATHFTQGVDVQGDDFATGIMSPERVCCDGVGFSVSELRCDHRIVADVVVGV